MNVDMNSLPINFPGGKIGLTPNELYEKTSAVAFENFYDAAMKLYDDTNALQLSAEQAQIDYITGKSDNMLSVMMAQEKAYTSLTFTVQVTNKVIESYREIMRMQI